MPCELAGRCPPPIPSTAASGRVRRAPGPGNSCAGCSEQRACGGSGGVSSRLGPGAGLARASGSCGPAQASHAQGSAAQSRGPSVPRLSGAQEPEAPSTAPASRLPPPGRRQGRVLQRLGRQQPLWRPSPAPPWRGPLSRLKADLGRTSRGASSSQTPAPQWGVQAGAPLEGRDALPQPLSPTSGALQAPQRGFR